VPRVVDGRGVATCARPRRAHGRQRPPGRPATGGRRPRRGRAPALRPCNGSVENPGYAASSFGVRVTS
jgi:hypothetical protein